MITLRSPFLAQTLEELRQLKERGPKSAYRAALVVAAPALVEALIERLEEVEAASPERLSQTVADWLWLRILCWRQMHQVPDDQLDDLYKLVESIRTGLPLKSARIAASSFADSARHQA